MTKRRACDKVRGIEATYKTVNMYDYKKNPELRTWGLNVFQRLSFFRLTITTVLCLLSVALVEPLANDVRDDVPDDGCSDANEKDCEHVFTSFHEQNSWRRLRNVFYLKIFYKARLIGEVDKNRGL